MESLPASNLSAVRSEERRVGKGVDLGGRRIIKNKKSDDDNSLDSKNTTN